MKNLQYILAAAVISLAGWGLATGTADRLAPYLLLLMGMMAAVTGIEEFKKRNSVSLALFAASAFVLVVGLYIM